MKKKRSYRRKRVLSKPAKRKFPKRLIFFDTETTIPFDDGTVTTLELKLGVAIYTEIDQDINSTKRVVINFTTVQEFIDILDTNNMSNIPILIFAHNVGFDVRVLELPERLHKLGWVSEPPIINDRVFIWRLKKDRKTITFLDTSNYAAVSLSRLGKDLGLEKLEVDFETTNIKDLFTYCLRDTEILEKFVLDFIKYVADNNLGYFSLTIASQSMSAFRHRFHKATVNIHLNEQATILEREGYYGGRTESFFIGKLPKQPYYYMDVNSMYPFSMATSEVPVKLRGYTDSPPLAYLAARLAKFYVIADVTLRTEKPVYPYRYNRKLTFPIGEFRTVIHSPELKYALADNAIKQLHSCAVYERKVIFKDYVDFFYREKQRYTSEQKPALRYITKIYLNSLYGKFGQMQTHRTLLLEEESDIIWRLPIYDTIKHRSYQEICWYGNVYREEREGETAISFPAIAASITAYSRMLLWKYITLAGRENVFYCDTDSLICNQTGYDRLSQEIDPLTLGKLKLEGQSDTVEIFGAKDYIFGDKVKVKGIPKNATQLREGRWRLLQFQGFTTWINEGGTGAPKAWYRTKERKSKYNKGIVLESGRVTPIKLPV